MEARYIRTVIDNGHNWLLFDLDGFVTARYDVENDCLDMREWEHLWAAQEDGTRIWSSPETAKFMENLQATIREVAKNLSL